MKKVFDEFVRLPLNKMSEKISEITYLYNNTEVPKAPYKKVLEQTLIETIAADTTVQVALLNAVVKSLNGIEKESSSLFLKALICLDNGIKIEDMDARTYYALDQTVDMIFNNPKMKLLNININETYENYYNQGLPFFDSEENNRKIIN